MAGNDTELMNAALTGKRWKKQSKIMIGICVLVVCIGGYLVYGRLTKKESTYLTMPVTQGKISNAVQATGTVKPLHEVALYFKTQGTLKTLNVSAGDSVKAGQVLAVEDDSDLRANVEQAQSDLLQAKLRLQQSELDYEKASDTYTQQQTLYNQGAVAKSDLDQSKRDFVTADVSVQLAKASIQTAQAKLVIVQTDLKNATLTAPFSGVVAQVNGEVGQETGNSTNPTVNLISSELQVQTTVNEVDIGNVKVGQNVEFTVTSFPNQTFQGKVSKISSQATTTNNIQLFEVDIATDNLSHQLLAGMSVTANILISERDNVVRVQNTALAYAKTYMQTMAANMRSASGQNSSNRTGTGNRTGTAGSGGWSGRKTAENTTSGSNSQTTVPIVVLENGKPAVKRITTGLSDGQNTEVVNGLKAGEQVVIGTTDSTQSTTTSSSGTGSTGSGQRQNTTTIRRGGGGFGPGF
jgi:HlyD family secretion protein